MPTHFPRSPQLTKGAIVGVDVYNPLASVIVFQYNPTSLTRSLQAKTPTEEGASAEVLRLDGAPSETISIAELHIDAMDQLETAEPVATDLGIYPQLSALEMLLYPKSATVIRNSALLLAGTLSIAEPPSAPFTLFVWGMKRVLPVRITGFSITEQAYDPRLNPIRASVNLDMRVLTYNDFSVTHPGHALFLAHQVAKEVMATVGSAGAIAEAPSSFSLTSGL